MPGVLPYAMINNEMHFLVGKERGGKDKGTWCLLSGGTEEKDKALFANLEQGNTLQMSQNSFNKLSKAKNPAKLWAACREAHEESAGLLGKTNELAKQVFSLNGSENSYLLEVKDPKIITDKKFSLAKKKYEKMGKGYGCYREMSELKWVKAADLIDASVHKNGIFTLNGKEEQIRPFFMRTLQNNADYLKSQEFLDKKPVSLDKTPVSTEAEVLPVNNKTNETPGKTNEMPDNHSVPFHEAILSTLKRIERLLVKILAGQADHFSVPTDAPTAQKNVAEINKPAPQAIVPERAKADAPLAVKKPFKAIEIDSLAQINRKSMNRDTLVIFDIDETLLIDKKYKNRKIHAKHLKGKQCIPVESNVAQLVEQIKKVNGNKTVLGLTRRDCATQHPAHEEVQKLNIPLSRRSFKHLNGKKTIEKGVFNNGVIYTNGGDKGKHLEHFLSQAAAKYKNIVMVDDRLHNLESVNKFAEKCNIPFTAYHMKGADKYMAKH